MSQRTDRPSWPYEPADCASVVAFIGCSVADKRKLVLQWPIGVLSAPALHKPTGTYFCNFFSIYFCD